MNSGFNGFLAKPIELSALDRVLKQFLPPELIVKQNVSGDGENSGADINDTRLNISEETARLIDVETGMFYTGGTKATYLSILSQFVNKGTDKITAIKNFYDTKDWKNYVIEVHALKSSSLSLGAKDLSAFAKKLEIAGKAGDYSVIEANQDKLIELYEKVIEAGRTIITENVREGKPDTPDNDSSNEKQSIERQELVRLLEELKVACDSFDSDVIEEIAQKLMNITFENIEVDKFARSIKSAAKDFDYDKASVLCGKLKSAVGEEN